MQKNNVEYTESLDEVISRVTKIQTPAQEKKESLSVLGGAEKIAGLNISPPSTGILMLLDIVDSPLLKGKSDVPVKAVYEALYILHKGKDVVPALMSRVSQVEQKKEAFESTAKTDAHFSAYLQSIGNADAFDVAVADFAVDLGVINIQQTAVLLIDYLGSCFEGFEMIPPLDEPDKKKDLTQNG